MPLDILLEGLLFYKAGPLKKAQILKQFSVTLQQLEVSINTLQKRLENGALRLVETETDIQLATSPELSPFIEGLRKQEIKADIGKAGAETLSIILFRGPVSKNEIDQIRGVNSATVLRQLQIRGLIEKVVSNGQSHHFIITTDLLATLGITNKHELPDFARIADELDTFLQESSK
jgi:segregation and condensation protein B